MKWLAIDPGETTGWSEWEGSKKIDGGQTPLWQFIHELDAFPEDTDLIVCEDWALYPWKLKSMAWDKCRTARGIGALELISWRYDIPIVLQPASIKDSAQAAGAEAYYVTPVHENRHENDSIQHAVYYLATKGVPGD